MERSLLSYLDLQEDSQAALDSSPLLPDDELAISQIDKKMVEYSNLEYG